MSTSALCFLARFPRRWNKPESAVECISSNFTSLWNDKQKPLSLSRWLYSFLPSTASDFKLAVATVPETLASFNF